MSSLIRWKPTWEILGLTPLERLWDWNGEDLWEDFLETEGKKENAWVPRVESYEKEGNYVIKADLPGVEAKDVQVTVENGCLTIQGERKEDKEIKEKEVLRREMFYGSFRRALPVPEGIKADQMKAKYHDGVLEITAPIKERHLSKKIEVQVEK